MLQGREIKILVVDDDPHLRDSLVLFFNALKFTSFTAGSGQEGLQVLRQNPHIDIVLSDIRMANGGGIQFLKDVRQHFHRELKFYLMTGFDDLTMESAFALGADGLFAKPFSIAAMRDCIQQSFLRRDYLWARRPGPHQAEITFRLKSFQASLDQGEIHFGRSGFFIKSPAVWPEVGQLCRFDLTFTDDSEVSGIGGSGWVRWVRKSRQVAGPPGLGIEICYLEDACREFLIRYLADLKCVETIPLK